VILQSGLAGPVTALLSVLTFGCIYALLSLGLNVHYGYTGLLNFGHVAFFAVGAFAAAVLTMPPPGPDAGYAVGLGLPVPAALPVSLGAAALAGGVLAALVGLTSVRLDTHYLAVATFALAGIVEDVLVNEAWLTRGTFGLNAVPRPGRAALGPFWWQVAAALGAAALVAGAYLVVERLMDAPFGRLLKGVREDERAASTLGKDAARAKLKSFAVGGALAGLAGGAYAHYVGSVVAVTFVALVTFLVWAALLLGGAGSNLGAVAGAFVLVGFREGTRYLPTGPLDGATVASLRFVVVGLLIVLVVRYRPAGLFGDPDEIVLSGEGD
jgi:branched-chain amino acid transport system permease protein